MIHLMEVINFIKHKPILEKLFQVSLFFFSCSNFGGYHGEYKNKE